ncbi:MAG: hypothetical protein K6F08_01220 [bacterium]|nr:hypothetical protein [bacterium]
MKVLFFDDESEDRGKQYLILFGDNKSFYVFSRDYLNLKPWEPVEGDKKIEIALLSEVDDSKRTDTNRDSRFFTESSFYEQISKELNKHLNKNGKLTKNLQNIQHCKTEMTNILNDIMVYKIPYWDANYFLKIIEFKKNWENDFGFSLDPNKNDNDENEK